jgi:error-prone DNA polymerase
MGFYSPATIIEDAKRHGVEVRPASVVHSEWDCTLEPLMEEEDHCLPRKWGVPPKFAVRMGLRFVKGVGEGDWERIRRAREEGPFESVEDFVRRSSLSKDVLCVLAQAGALESLRKERRDALWEVLGVASRSRPSLSITENEPKVSFTPLSFWETVLWDYRTQDHSPLAHPLAMVRAELRKKGLPTAQEICGMPNGRFVRYAGLVICRQRPGTARGVTFLTLEDETGFVNVVIWPHLYAKHMGLVKTAPVVGVSGTLQVEGDVVNLVARSLWVPDLHLKGVRKKSRDFQ